MMCLTDGILRAKFDGELSETEMREAETHLIACAVCRERAEAMVHQAREVDDILSTLAPSPNEPATDAAMALARFMARQRNAEAEAPSFAGRLFARRLRPAWAALAAACLALGLLSFAPARTWAQRILAMLRVQKITVVPVDLKSLGGPDSENAAGKLIGQMISDNVVVTIHGKPQDVASAAEASQRAGYKVRLLGERADAPQLTVEGEQAFHMTVDRERVQGILAELGHSEVNLPASLDGATIAAHIPPVVVARYGNCPADRPKAESAPAQNGPPAPSAEVPDRSNCLVLIQVPSPTVSVPPELNLAELAEAGLQVAGMTAEQAHAFCKTVDWTSTLVVPIPRGVSSYETVTVDGVEGTLISVPRERRHPAGYALVWVKNGVIYSLTGCGNSAEAVPLAETLN
jgi:hypothetical protein